MPPDTWYGRPGVVRRRARPSPPPFRDECVIPRSAFRVQCWPCAVTRRFGNYLGRRSRIAKRPSVHLMTVRAPRIPVAITSRVTTDHSASRPDPRYGRAHRSHHSRSIDRLPVSGGDRRFRLGRARCVGARSGGRRLRPCDPGCVRPLPRWRCGPAAQRGDRRDRPGRREPRRRARGRG